MEKANELKWKSLSPISRPGHKRVLLGAFWMHCPHVAFHPKSDRNSPNSAADGEKKSSAGW